MMLKPTIQLFFRLAPLEARGTGVTSSNSSGTCTPRPLRATGFIACSTSSGTITVRAQ